MSDQIPVKDAEHQREVPTAWRATFEAVVAALVADDEAALRAIADVEVPAGTFEQMRDAVADYGVTLSPLIDESWATSVSMWMDGHWDVLVDLQSIEEGPSDLVLSAKVFERSSGFRYEIYMVYVP